MSQNYYTIMKKLEQKEFAPVYFLEGEETYYIDKITDYIVENALTNEEKGFNQVVLYGKETSVNEIISSARRFPMMAEKQVVIVKEAQSLMGIDGLSIYLKDPQPSTILVIAHPHKKIDGRKGVGKALKNAGVYLEAKKLYDNEVPSWIVNYIKNLGFDIEPKAALLISESVGNELTKLENELQKLTISHPKNESITTAVVEKNIGISKDFNIFELQEALGEKNVLKANKIVRHMGQNPKTHPLVPMVSMLFNYFKKILIYHYQTNKSNSVSVAKAIGIHPFFLKQFQVAARNYNIRKTVEILGILRDFDRKTKGVGTGSSNESDLLTELVFKILH